MGTSDVLLTVTGTWSVLSSLPVTVPLALTPQPFFVAPTLAQELSIATVGGGGGGCGEVAKAGAEAAIATTGTVQAVPRTTVRREKSGMVDPLESG